MEIGRGVIDIPRVLKTLTRLEFAGTLALEFEKDEKGDKVHRTERYSGMLERSFVLPKDVDTKAIRAEAKEGVLTIHLPRTAVEKARPLAISIQ